MHYHAAPDAVVVVDTDGKILDANNLARTLFGYDRKELIGQSVEMLVPPDIRDEHVAHRAAYNNDPREREFRMVHGLRKDGTTFDCEVTLSPSTDHTYVVATVHDITQREVAKQCMQKLSNSLKVLEGMIE